MPDIIVRLKHLRLQTIFKSKSWYSADETLTSEMMNNHMSEYFNEIELKNISFIQAHR